MPLHLVRESNSRDRRCQRFAGTRQLPGIKINILNFTGLNGRFATGLEKTREAAILK